MLMTRLLYIKNCPFSTIYKDPGDSVWCTALYNASTDRYQNCTRSCKTEPDKLTSRL